MTNDYERVQAIEEFKAWKTHAKAITTYDRMFNYVRENTSDEHPTVTLFSNTNPATFEMHSDNLHFYQHIQTTYPKPNNSSHSPMPMSSPFSDPRLAHLVMEEDEPRGCNDTDFWRWIRHDTPKPFTKEDCDGIFEYAPSDALFFKSANGRFYSFADHNINETTDESYNPWMIFADKETCDAYQSWCNKVGFHGPNHPLVSGT